MHQTKLVVFRVTHHLKTIGRLFIRTTISCRPQPSRVTYRIIKIVHKNVEMKPILSTLTLWHTLEREILNTTCTSDLHPIGGACRRVNHSPNQCLPKLSKAAGIFAVDYDTEHVAQHYGCSANCVASQPVGVNEDAQMSQKSKRRHATVGLGNLSGISIERREKHFDVNIRLSKNSAKSSSLDFSMYGHYPRIRPLTQHHVTSPLTSDVESKTFEDTDQLGARDDGEFRQRQRRE